MKREQVSIILNRQSGRQNGQSLGDKLRAAFDAHGIDAKLIEIGKKDSVEAAARAAIQDHAQTIVVAGGDGTICGVAATLAGSEHRLGIIPAGTFNYFARSLNLPENLEDAVAIIAGGKTVKTDVAKINDHVFLNNASLGAYAAILQTREGIYRRWGRSRFAAYWSVIKALATLRAPLRLKVTVDGAEHTYRTPLVFAVNNAFQLEQMGLGGGDCIAAGKMVLLVAPDTNRWGLFKHAASLALGMAKRETDYRMHCGTEIRIEMKRKSRPVARDGELSRMTGPLHMRLQREALHLIVPSDFDKSVR